MKHITLFALAALFGASVQAQVFTSGFEDWTDGSPDEWMGAATNIQATSVAQVTEDVHGGASAVRLTNTSNTHQRFSTQSVEVTGGQGYEVTLWARGAGEVRLGFFNNGNYSTYTAYETINSSNWEEVTLTIIAPGAATDGEFILSVRATVEPEHLVLDDVSITEVTVAPPEDATIAEIQGTGDASPLVGQSVTTSGVVSALNGTSGYFLQDGTGPWSGIYVFGNPGALQRGDSITISGVVAEFNGQTQISSVTNTTVHGGGHVLTPTTISTNDGNTEPYESVLVRVVNASCLSAGAFGQFTMNDGSGSVLVDDVLYAHPFAVGSRYDITGILQYAFSEWRILPRDAADVIISTSIGELAGATITLFPNPANDALTIDLGTLSGRTEYSVVDATGRMVLADVITGVRNTIDVGALTNGMYVMTLRNSGSTWSTRIAVQH